MHQRYAAGLRHSRAEDRNPFGGPRQGPHILAPLGGGADPEELARAHARAMRAAAAGTFAGRGQRQRPIDPQTPAVYHPTPPPPPPGGRGAPGAIAGAARGWLNRPADFAAQASASIELVWSGDGSDGEVRLAAVVKRGPLSHFRLSINGIDKTSLLSGANGRRPLNVELDPGVEAFGFVLSAAETGRATVRLSAQSRYLERIESLPLQIEFKPTDRLRPGGGPARELLHAAAVTKKTWRGLTKGQKASDQLAGAKRAKLARDICKLYRWLQKDDLPDINASPKGRGAGHRTKAAADAAAKADAVAEAGMAEAIAQTIQEISAAEMVLNNMPLVGQIMAGAEAAASVGKSLAKLWSAHKISEHHATLIATPAASGHRPTLRAATEGFEQYELMLAAAHIAHAEAKGAELAIRSVPGAGVAVGALANAASVLFLVLKNFEDGRRARKANEMLRVADASQLPADYYRAISKGHVAILCHVLNNYSVAQILDLDPKSRLILEGIVPINGIFARARAAIAKIGKPATYQDRLGKAQSAVIALKKKAASTAEDLRYEVSRPQ